MGMRVAGCQAERYKLSGEAQVLMTISGQLTVVRCCTFMFNS